MPAPAEPAALHALADALRQAERVVLTTHRGPDGDAIGSEIGLAVALRKLGKHVTIFNNDPPPRVLEWILDHAGGGEHEPVIFDGSMAHRETINQADCILVLDTNAEGRLGDVGPAITSATPMKLLLDHHPHPEDWFDLAYTDTTSASTAELVYRLLCLLDADLIDADVATPLYAGIVTDTGRFRYSATTARTHRIAADLLERGGLSPEPIHVNLYDAWQTSGLKLLGLALDTIQTHHGGRLATMRITHKMLNHAGARLEEAEGFVNYALGVEGVQAAVILRETPGGTRASFRSKGDLAVNGWAQRFGGGGHRNAAGSFVPGTLSEALETVVRTAPKDLRDGPEDVAPAAADAALSDDDAALLAMMQGG
jgi:phosphoesterase RecJ-like protein